MATLTGKLAWSLHELRCMEHRITRDYWRLLEITRDKLRLLLLEITSLKFSPKEFFLEQLPPGEIVAGHTLQLITSCHYTRKECAVQ